jgi:hypothetical protein
MKTIAFTLSLLAAAVLTGHSARAEDNHNSQASQPEIPQLDPGETLEKLGFPAVTEKLTGWTKYGKGKVYTLPVKAGQHVKVTFSSKSRYAFMAIFDLSSGDDESFFGTDEDGPTADVTVQTDTTWLLKPYYSRVTRRRGLGAPYTILIEPQAAGMPQQQPPPSPTPPAAQQPPLFPPKAPGAPAQQPSLFPKPGAQPQ